MVFKKVFLTLILGAFAFAVSAHDGLDVEIMAEADGAWVKVMHNGELVPEAVITTDKTGDEEFVTDKYGRAYVYVDDNHAETVEFTVVDSEGNMATKAHLVSGDK
uniref:hypothetical protein n=1 Tax=Thaumasiovibrio occultus TaxID=1891184 RepID=UPI000B361AB9|nr:hypothetical protein [Thaumasiovibrio occultus]